MFDPLDRDSRLIEARLRWLRRLVWGSLFLERVTRFFWRPFFWLLFTIGLWLFEAPSYLGKWGDEAGLFIFLIVFGYLLSSSIRSFSWPRREEIDHRLETDSSLTHRPLSHIGDRLANPLKTNTRKFWEASRKAALSNLFSLKFSWPKAVTSYQDPLGLRYAVLLFVIGGFIIAGDQASDRITRNLFPFAFSANTTDHSDAVTLLVTPPDYTGLPKIAVRGSGKSDQVILIPEGSTLKAQVSHGIGKPYLDFGKSGKVHMDEIGKKSWGIETPMRSTDAIDVRQFWFSRLSFPVTYSKDSPPEIMLSGELASLPKGGLQIPVKVKDDYGVIELTMRMTLDALIEDHPTGTAVHESRSIMSPPGEEIEIKPVYELSWHSWAGLPVNISVEVTDHLGQRGLLPPINTVLPEREFYHPVAKQIIELRKRLIWTPETDRFATAYELETLLQAPDDFGGNPVVFLSIRSIASRLAYAHQTESLMPVISQMWDTALRIEDGNLTIAARSLRSAREKLEKMLRDPQATEEELAGVVAELEEAMAQYFAELYREMQKQLANTNNMPMLSPEALENAINIEDLAAFLDQLRAETLSGNRDAARQMLSQLQQMMDGLDPSMTTQMPPEMQAMAERINKLQELIEEQNQLIEETRKQASETSGAGRQAFSDFLPFDPKIFEDLGIDSMPPSPHENSRPSTEKQEKPGVDTSLHQDKQDALRYSLGELMLETDEQTGAIPENLQQAEQEMRGAGTELGENKPHLAIPHQERAIEYLQDSQEEMQEQMAAMMQQMTFIAFGMGQTDPLGRPMDQGDGPSLLPSGKIDIPDKGERKRAYEILEILRKRSGEFQRPNYELEYYRRLMRKF